MDTYSTGIVHTMEAVKIIMMVHASTSSDHDMSDTPVLLAFMPIEYGELHVLV